jgi:hypothetical protein
MSGIPGGDHPPDLEVARELHFGISAVVTDTGAVVVTGVAAADWPSDAELASYVQ